MKFRIVETTGDPDHVPCRWQADCGRFKYSIMKDELSATHFCGLIGHGSDWLEMDSVSVHDSFDKAEAACKAHLAGIVAELQGELT
jgi:hypothetical protein